MLCSLFFSLVKGKHLNVRSRMDFPDTVMANVDHHVVNLLYEMLEPDTLKRANIERVLKHPWTRGNERWSCQNLVLF